ncbi:MAG: DUF2288 domain-containing protein [Planktothrix sp.]
METESLRSQLTENLDEAEWDWLTPHLEREIVIIVESQLDLLTVGEAIAQDDSVSVQHWISESLIHKPSPEQISQWNDQPKKRFQALIVEPFVLIQEL